MREGGGAAARGGRGGDTGVQSGDGLTSDVRDVRDTDAGRRRRDRRGGRRGGHSCREVAGLNLEDLDVQDTLHVVHYHGHVARLAHGWTGRKAVVREDCGSPSDTYMLMTMSL